MTRNSPLTSPQRFLGLYSALGLLFLIIGFLTFLDVEQQKNLLTEGGLFESLTVYLYIFCQTEFNHPVNIDIIRNRLDYQN